MHSSSSSSSSTAAAAAAAAYKRLIELSGIVCHGPSYVDIAPRAMTPRLVSRFGLAVRRYAGKQKDLGSNPLRLFFLFKKCCLWTLSCDFVSHNE